MPDSIPPAEAARLLRQGTAALVDVREADEFAREHIPGAANLPLSRLETLALPPGPLVICCRSGARTTAHASRLAAKAGTQPIRFLAGGLEAWKRAGLPIRADRRPPLELMRQVQIAAGGMVVLGVAFGTLASPWFLGLAGFVGAGLVFAGVTGTCGLAHLLRRMPWNRPPGLPPGLPLRQPRAAGRAPPRGLSSR